MNTAMDSSQWGNQSNHQFEPDNAYEKVFESYISDEDGEYFRQYHLTLYTCRLGVNKLITLLPEIGAKNIFQTNNKELIN